MDVDTLIGSLRERGVALVLVGDMVRLDGPPEVMIPEVVDLVRAHKAAIVDALRDECAGSMGPCIRCGRAVWPGCGEHLAAGLVCGDCASPDISDFSDAIARGRARGAACAADDAPDSNGEARGAA
jgi:hypothetical protein